MAWLIGTMTTLSPGETVKLPALVEALRLATPQTETANPQLYTDWQIQPKNISRWSKLCLGQTLTPEEFAANIVQTRQVLVCVIQDLAQQEYTNSRDEAIAVRRVAAWWLTGDPNRYNQGQVETYTQQVLLFYKFYR